MKKILCILLLIINIYVQAGTIDPDTDDKLYLNKASKYNYIGEICGTYEDNKEFMASAIAIDDHHILTAAHIICNSKNVLFKINSNKYNIDKIIVHYSFDMNKFGTGDIALGYSSQSLNLQTYPELYEENNEQGQTCTIAGYGLTGDFRLGAVLFDAKMRAGNNIIDAIENDILVCDASKRSDKNFVDLEFFPACGDSGGGLFIDGKLAGINSCIFGNTKKLESKYHEKSGHTRVSIFIDWIRKNKTNQ